MISTLLTNIFFELNLRRKQLSTYAYFLIFFSLSILLTLAAGGAFKGVAVSFGLSNKVLINSPVALNLFISGIAPFGLFIIAPIFGQAIFKDYGAQFDQIVYATPAHRKGFLLGRFVGAFLTMSFIFSGIGLGIYFASFFPNIQQDLLGPNHWLFYLMPYLANILPNIFIFGSIFFLLATKTKKMAPIYIAGILIFMGWMLAGQLTSDLDNKMITSLIDPFGLSAAGELTKYWSVEDQNTQIIGLQSYLLLNRLLWLSLGFVCFALSLLGFKSQAPTAKSKKQKISKPASPVKIEFKPTKPSFHRLSKKNMLFSQIRFELSQIFKSIYFQSLALAGILYIFIVSSEVGKLYGTTTFPVTYNVLELLGTSFELFILIILTFYTGEAIWRDRNNKIDQVIDAYPTPLWVFSAAKMVSLMLMITSLLFVIIICGVIAQLFNGYTFFELGLYLKSLFGMRLLTFFNITALAFFIQVMVNNKYVGHGLMILYYVFITWLPLLGFERKIYLYNSQGMPSYSDMNLYGRFLNTFFIFKFYWMSFAGVLLILSLLFWQRGTDQTFKQRLKEFKRRLKPLHLVLTSLFLVGFVSLGSIIFYNTEVKNTFVSQKANEQNQVDYEKKYKAYQNKVLPTLTAVNAKVDIFPKQNKVLAQLDMTFSNKSTEPIEKLFVNLPSAKDKPTLNFNWPMALELEDKKLDVRIYKFEKVFNPGDTLKLKYNVSVDRSHFPNAGPDTKIVRNGTFFNNFHYFPLFGYQKDNEISLEKTRKKYQLSHRPRVPKINDTSAKQHNYMSTNASWIDFETTISTSNDQTAIAPGYLTKKWQENGRNYFHYKMDQKILNFYSFLSGHYELKEDQWKDVKIEIYHHKRHDKNLQRMIEATKMSLDYFTENFGPYQHKQYRIIEFPRYQTFAQAFPNTIPFSEGIGFIAKVEPDDPKDVDFPFYVTAHELAHQWWAHQLIGADVQGSTMMSETFSQYSALMVMQKKYGKDKMKRFLRYELDKYLGSRSKENIGEMPLSRNEVQSYIYYNKGSLVMYALQDRVGENIVNQALKDYLKAYSYQKPPFTTSIDFLEILKQKTSPKDHSFISDLFEKMILFQNRPLKASYKKLANGEFEVHATFSCEKYYASSEGKEEKTPFQLPIDIGIQDKDGKFIYFSKHDFKDGETTFKFNLKKEPYKIGVDPLNMLVDKNPDDNEIKLSKDG